jgi:SAM-dependent methyltransferase
LPGFERNDSQRRAHPGCRLRKWTVIRSGRDPGDKVSIAGIDVLLRPERQIEVTEFDGTTIPFADSSFDVVMFVDVLHHTNNPDVLLAEAGASRGDMF